MQKRKLQVFVSSTFIDLKEERQTAVQAILEAGHIYPQEWNYLLLGMKANGIL